MKDNLFFFFYLLSLPVSLGMMQSAYLLWLPSKHIEYDHQISLFQQMCHFSDFKYAQSEEENPWYCP